MFLYILQRKLPSLDCGLERLLRPAVDDILRGKEIWDPSSEQTVLKAIPEVT